MINDFLSIGGTNLQGPMAGLNWWFWCIANLGISGGTDILVCAGTDKNVCATCNLNVDKD